MEIICNTLQWWWEWYPGIGLELKKLQFQYSNYEGMGVPISREILSWRPFYDDLFPYFYDVTTMDKYKSALAVESTGCCVTKIEYAKSNGIEKDCMFRDLIHSINSFILFIAWICIINVFVENNQGTDDVGHTSNIPKVA